MSLLYFIFIFTYLAAASAESLGVWEKTYRNGEEGVISLTAQECTPLGSWSKKINAVDPKNGCFILYSEPNCYGNSLLIDADTIHLDDLDHHNFGNKSQSISRCAQNCRPQRPNEKEQKFWTVFFANFNSRAFCVFQTHYESKEQFSWRFVLDYYPSIKSIFEFAKIEIGGDKFQYYTLKQLSNLAIKAQENQPRKPQTKNKEPSTLLKYACILEKQAKWRDLASFIEQKAAKNAPVGTQDQTAEVNPEKVMSGTTTSKNNALSQDGVIYITRGV